MPGLVPEYEEREAARFGLYNWRHWGRLPWQEKADTVAHYRMNQLIRLHQEDAVNKEVERQMKMRKK